MQSTMFVEMAPGVTVSDLYEHLKSTYEVLFVWLSGINYLSAESYNFWEKHLYSC
jgi:hypothetical protein